MCGRPDDGMMKFVLRAIAEGAAGADLAKFALAEQERVYGERKLMRATFDSLGNVTGMEPTT